MTPIRMEPSKPFPETVGYKEGFHKRWRKASRCIGGPFDGRSLTHTDLCLMKKAQEYEQCNYPGGFVFVHQSLLTRAQIMSNEEVENCSLEF